MKKFAKVFAMAAAVAAFGFGFTSCDDKDDSGSKDLVLTFTKVAEKSVNFYDYYASNVIDPKLFGDAMAREAFDDFALLKPKMYMKIQAAEAPARGAAPEENNLVWELGMSMDYSSVWGQLTPMIESSEEEEDYIVDTPLVYGDYTVSGNVYTLNILKLYAPEYNDDELIVDDSWVDSPVSGWKTITIKNDSFTIVIPIDDPLVFGGEVEEIEE